MKLLFLDTETTGIDVTKDRLCQICFKTGEALRCEYFKPPLPISIKATSITHITNKMVADKPAFIGSELSKKLSELFKTHVLVAHNVAFDAAILKVEGITVGSAICTFKLAQYLDTEAVIPEYNLQYLRYYLDLDVEATPHTAQGDVAILEALFARLFKKMCMLIPDEEAALQKMIVVSTEPILLKKFPYGHYVGKMIADIAKSDRSYLQWLLQKKKAEPIGEEDMIYTLQHYLLIN